MELPRLDTATGENAPTAALALDFFSEGREQKALLQFENGRRSSVINGVKKKTGSALVGKVCAVIFWPSENRRPSRSVIVYCEASLFGVIDSASA